MRALLILLVVLVATQAEAVQVVSIVRDVTYTGGLEEPDMIGDSRSSFVLGSFTEEFSDVISAPPDAEAAAAVSQFSFASLDSGLLFIQATADVSTRVTTLADGTIADALAQTALEVVFITDEITQLTVDVTTSSSMGIFFDGPGAGEVESSHVGSFLLCVVDGGCLADLFAEDITDNGLAVAKGVQDSIVLPPGHYQVQLVAISQSISRDIGSAVGSAAFSAEITVEPLPEPGAFASGFTALCLIAARCRRGRAERL